MYWALIPRFQEAKIPKPISTSIGSISAGFTMILLMEEILHHLGCSPNLVNNGINYQPQPVQDFFHQQDTYIYSFLDLLFFRSDNHAPLQYPSKLRYFGFSLNSWLMVTWLFGIRIGMPLSIPIPFIFGDSRTPNHWASNH